MATMASGTMRRFFACCAAALLLPLPASGQAVPEYDLKAAFIYNFALFTDWPQGTVFEGNTLIICVNPSSPMHRPLAGLGEKTIKGRRVTVRHAGIGPELRACHVLFVDGNDRDRWGQIRNALGSSSVLTISDDDEISREGSVIRLAMERKRIVFDIDLRAARQAKLVFSSKLLRLARTVQ